MDNKNQQMVGVFLWASIAACILIYWPGLKGVFLVDDITSLHALNANGGVTNFDNLMNFIMGSNSGSLGRPIAMLSFLIDDQYYPGSVEKYRYTNLLIHCLCGLTIFIFINVLLKMVNIESKRSEWIAAITTLWWLILPINVSTTLYVVQRMTQLSMLFTLIGLVFYLYCRKVFIVNKLKGIIFLVGGLYFFGGLAVLSKENGVLIFIYALACECFITYKNNNKFDRKILFVLLFPLMMLAGYLAWKFPSFLADYQFRDFTLAERLMTETRIVCDYLYKALFSNIRTMGLMQDDIKISKSLFEPYTTIYSILFHCVLLITAYILRIKQPILLFLVIWFYGGHLLESTFIPLELYFEHRNYLPILAVLLFVVTMFYKLEKGWIILSIMIIVSMYMCYERALIWGDPNRQIVFWAKNHPSSLRAQTSYAKYLIRIGEYEVANKQLAAMKSVWPQAFHIDLIRVNLKCLGLTLIDESYEQSLMRINQADYTSQVSSELENTINFYKNGSCKGLKKELIHKTLEGVTKREKFPGKVKASAALWNADLYIAERDLNGAMESLELSYKYNKDSVPRYLQAKILASAGLIKESNHYIDMAIEFESNKSLLKQKNLTIYKHLKEALLEETKNPK